MADRLKHAVKYAKKLTKVRDDRECFVYVIECDGFVKIGIADDPKFRMTGLQVGCPYELKIIAKFKTCRAVYFERELHKQWERYEIRGEWFKLPAGEMAIILNSDRIEDLIG